MRDLVQSLKLLLDIFVKLLTFLGGGLLPRNDDGPLLVDIAHLVLNCVEPLKRRHTNSLLSRDREIISVNILGCGSSSYRGIIVPYQRPHHILMVGWEPVPV